SVLVNSVSCHCSTDSVWSSCWLSFLSSRFFFFNDAATTEIYTLSLHDALPISQNSGRRRSGWRLCSGPVGAPSPGPERRLGRTTDRKSTRLNSSHVKISYAVFCLKKKNKAHTVDYRICTNHEFHAIR